MNNIFNLKNEYILNLNNNKLDSNYDYILSIEKRRDDFIILNLTDIQLIMDDINNDREKEVFSIIDELIKKVNPDLITITGDQTLHGNKIVINEIGKKLDSYNIPWAPIFGNHDLTYEENDLELSNLNQANLYESFKNCCFKKGPLNLDNNEDLNNAIGNYIINIYEKDNDNFKVIRSLVFVNSGDRIEVNENDYKNRLKANNDPWSKLTDKQVDFINWNSINVQKYNTNKVPISLFTHIPLFAYSKAINEAINSPYDYFNDRENFLNYMKSISIDDSYKDKAWKDGYKNSFGVMYDSDVCSFKYDEFVFERIIENNYLDSVICGHDHTNNFVIVYKNVLLAYALKTGSGCYFNKDLSGGTKITILNNEKPKIEHIYINK